MAIPKFSKTNYKLKNALSSGDYSHNNVHTRINHTRTSMESKIASEKDNDHDTESKNIENHDRESVYEESLYSDISDEEFESTNAKFYIPSDEKSSLNILNSKTITTKRNSVYLDKEYVSASKINDSSIVLEDRLKSLSLHEIQPVKYMPQTRQIRKNMSFTNNEIMKIEHDNEILLRKIMAQQKPPKVKIQTTQTRVSSSAINRKKLQRKIEEDNMILLRRLQQAKPCVDNTNKIQGYRATHL